MHASTTSPPVAVADVSRLAEGNAARLQLCDLVKRYRDVEAVRNVSLDIKPGEWVTMLGPSGSGKTTTLAMVAGFERPTSGSIKLGDRDITRLATHKRDLGMIFQGYALFPHMTVFENVAFPMKFRKVGKAETKKRVMECLEIVGLGGLELRRPAELSGGQQQRVGLARAFVHRPPILLMDEPLSALDKSLRGQMQVELRTLHQELGTTVLFVTHDQEEALGLSDRIVVMNDGVIVQVAEPTEIYESPESTFVASFLGSAQFVEGRIRRVAPDATAVLAVSSGGELVGRCAPGCDPGNAAKAVLRPEDASLDRPGEPANAVPVQVVAQVYLGDRIRCQARFADGEEGMFWLDHSQRSRVAIGDEITLYWPSQRTVFVADSAAG